MKKLTPTMRIVLTAMFAALSAVVNAFVTIRIGSEFKFSFVILIAFVAGYILGAPLAFVVGFVGDLLGWLLFVDGAYNPIIGISNGLLAFIPGIVFGLKRPIKQKNNLISFLLKTVLAYVISYFVCTVILSSTGIWIYTAYIQGKYQTLFAWYAYRAVAQLPNTLINLVATIVIFIPLKSVNGIKEYL